MCEDRDASHETPLAQPLPDGQNKLITYTVSRQQREIGVRMALGADAGDVVGDVMKRTLALTALGTALGIAGALVAGRFLQGLLFGVSAVDLTTYLEAVELVVGAA